MFLSTYSFIALPPDPYSIVSFDHHSIRSRVVKQSVCPTWDQTIVEAVQLFGDPHIIQRNPPPIIIEFFDKDQVVGKRDAY